MKVLFYTILLCVFSSISFSIKCFADIKIEDPNNLLTSADQFLGTLNFNQSFIMGNKATYTNYVNTCNYGCENDGCWAMCEMKERQTVTEVYTCSESSVSYGNDEGSFYLELSKDQFESINGNLSRYVLIHLDEQFQLPGYLRLNKFTNGKYKDELSPTSREYETMTLWGEYILESGAGKFDVIITLAKDVPAIAQIIRLRLDQQTIYRLKGIH